MIIKTDSANKRINHFGHFLINSLGVGLNTSIYGIFLSDQKQNSGKLKDALNQGSQTQSDSRPRAARDSKKGLAGHIEKK